MSLQQLHPRGQSAEGPHGGRGFQTPAGKEVPSLADRDCGKTFPRLARFCTPTVAGKTRGGTGFASVPRKHWRSQCHSTPTVARKMSPRTGQIDSVSDMEIGEHGSTSTEDRRAGGLAVGGDGQIALQRQFHRRDRRPEAGGALRPRGGASIARPGRPLAGSNDVQLGPALHDDRAGRPALWGPAGPPRSSSTGARSLAGG